MQMIDNNRTVPYGTIIELTSRLMLRKLDLPEKEKIFTRRQAEVLEGALRLLVAEGEGGLTTLGVAKATNCSKESLYRWFGDRDGMLEAMIIYQASKIRNPVQSTMQLDRVHFLSELTQFCIDLLSVLTSKSSLALNRLAISQCSRGEDGLGKSLLQLGQNVTRQRVNSLIAAAIEQGYVRLDDAGEAYQYLFGLVVKDTQIRLLHGEIKSFSKAKIKREAADAVAHFMSLYGSGANADDVMRQRQSSRAQAEAST